MRGVTLLGTSLALAVPAILWPPKPVRAAEPAPVSEVCTTTDSQTAR